METGGSQNEWGLVELFGIDGGELTGLTPEQGFVLGVEWEMFRRQLLALSEAHGSVSLQAPLHDANKIRCQQMAQRSGFHVSFVDEQEFEGWTTIVVRRGRRR